ncbi:MAG: hypothetical protein KDI74_05420 [Gammaproteobacteria bacterium]|nr:hypothetical protein [Gammaproteobacteria bacterium]
MMSLLREFHQIIRRIGGAVTVPRIEQVLLPSCGQEEGKRDEFGFLLLADGSVGPFYTSLDNSLPSLRADVSGNGLRHADPVALALQLGDSRLQTNALALGALNAISQFLMRRAGFDPTAAVADKKLSEPCGKVGMVGFFGPVVERLLALGRRITVIEKNPARVPVGLDLQVSSDPSLLADCDYIICTASTLINNTLEEILGAVSPSSIVYLMGPSASCLPDPLFSRGIDLVGGVLIDETDCLRRALSCGESWGRCGRKYQLSTEAYPGLDALLAEIER